MTIRIRLSKRELRAIIEALNHRLAGAIDADETGCAPKVYERALFWAQSLYDKKRGIE